MKDPVVPLPRGIINAINEMNKLEKAMAQAGIPKNPKGYRIPKDLPDDVKEAAQWAFQRLIDVAAGRIPPKKAPAVLKAAVEIRKEICGPIAQQVQVDVKGRLEHLLTRSMEEAPPAPALETTIVQRALTTGVMPEPLQSESPATPEGIAGLDVAGAED